MRKSFWVIALLLVAVHAPEAYADSYSYTAVFSCDPTITCTSVPLPVTDIMFPHATFNITWDNTIFSVHDRHKAAFHLVAQSNQRSPDCSYLTRPPLAPSASLPTTFQSSQP